MCSQQFLRQTKNIAHCPNNQKKIHSKKEQRNKDHPGAPLSSTENLLASTVRGLCRPEDRSKKDTKGFELANQALLCYSAISPLPLLHSSMLLSIRLP